MSALFAYCDKCLCKTEQTLKRLSNDPDNPSWEVWCDECDELISED